MSMTQGKKHYEEIGDLDNRPVVDGWLCRM
jgi:hypothetical protein